MPAGWSLGNTFVRDITSRHRCIVGTLLAGGSITAAQQRVPHEPYAGGTLSATARRCEPDAAFGGAMVLASTGAARLGFYSGAGMTSIPRLGFATLTSTEKRSHCVRVSV